jgi:ATP-dependent helicase/nuclease subunit A
LSDAASPSHAIAAAGTVAVTELPKPPDAAGAAPAAVPRAEASRAAKLGRAVHRVLQWITAGQQATDVRGLAAAALAEFDLPPAAGEAVVSYAQTIRGSPALQRFFDPALFAWSADEFDVVSEGESLRIDRLVRMGPEQRPSWWVIDYKLAFDAATDENLRRQLTRYRDAVQALVGDAPVHAAFVTGDGALHELEPLGPAVE